MNKDFCIAEPVESNYLWYDYYVAKSLRMAMEKRGWKYVPNTNNLRIYMLGFPLRAKYKDVDKWSDKARNVAWIFGHPNQMKNYKLTNIFHKIFISSHCVMEHNYSAKTHYTPMPSDFPFENSEVDGVAKTRDVVFIGSARPCGYPVLGRKIVYDLIWGKKQLPFNLELAGFNWDRELPREYHSFVTTRHHVPREDFRKYIASAKIVIHDHHPHMCKMGMISHKLMDSMGCGSFIISDHNKEIEKYMSEVQTYKNKTDVMKLIIKWLQSAEDRQKAIAKYEDCVTSYDETARDIELHI